MEYKVLDADDFLSWLDEAEKELRAERRKDDRIDKRDEGILVAIGIVREYAEKMCSMDSNQKNRDIKDTYNQAIDDFEKEFRRRTWMEGELVEKIAEELRSRHKDTERQEVILRLPCKEAYSKAGEVVYLVCDNEIKEYFHCGILVNKFDGEVNISLSDESICFGNPGGWCKNVKGVNVDEIGKTLFFTREEAEKKLNREEKQ